MILVKAQGSTMTGADFRFTDAIGIDLEKADIRWSDLRNADLTKANVATTRMWGSRVRNTKLPANMGHMTLVLKVGQIFQGFGSKRQKAKEARERKRVQKVAELVRDREAARKRRTR